jgi:hypothetical protein
VIAAKYNIVINQGADFSLGLALSEGGTPTDLTDFLVRAQIRPKTYSETVTGTFVGTITNAAQGTLSLTMPNSITSDIPKGTYAYDLQIYTFEDGIVNTLLYGSVTVNPGVTR